MATTESLTNIIENLTTVLADADKCDKGNKSAGVRIRKAAQEATKDLKALRQEVLNQRD